MRTACGIFNLGFGVLLLFLSPLAQFLILIAGFVTLDP
jgi:hypothetical protein